MKDLALQVLYCESEHEVSKLLTKLPRSATWHPLDGRETNFNVVTNQAATGAKALTELCTNMVDAILLRRAIEKGIDPISAHAPKSVVEAVKEFQLLRGARSGILAEVDDPKYLREFAEKNLVIGVTAANDANAKPCFTFIDAGEGQQPDDFEKTFLSLSSGRKKDIPFVQGKYNMGSSGVLSYCGRCWYKLTISRRFESSSPWGWTLARRRPGGGTPIAEYLKIGGQIPRFHQEQIFPLIRHAGIQDDKVSRTDGTVVKLYSYEFGVSANFRTIREALNENLVSTVLPFRLMDFRAKPDKRRGGRRALGIDERTTNGMDFQLRRVDDPEDDETNQFSGEIIHVGDVTHPELGHVLIHAVPLPKNLPGWLKARRNNSRVYHSVNGQVQYKQTRGFLSQKCRLPGLKDRIVVLVDASEMTEAAHNDVWKGDRETIRQTQIGRLYESQVQDAIRHSEPLRKLQEKIATEETSLLAKQAGSKLFNSIVATDRHIAQLLPDGEIVHLPGLPPSDTGGSDAYSGQYSPSFVKLVGRSLRERGIDVPLDGFRRVRFETDASNDWLTRPDNRGKVFLADEAQKVFSLGAALNDGSLSVKFEPPNAPAGVAITTQLILKDDSMPEPITASIRLRVVSQRQNPRGGRRRRKKGRGQDDKPGAGKAKGLPRTTWLTKDGRTIGEQVTEKWPDDFTDQDGGLVKTLTEDTNVYKINYDNAHFRHFLIAEQDQQSKKLIVEQYRLSMLIVMMGFEYAYSNTKDANEKAGLEDKLDSFRKIAAQGAATVIMSIARTLPSMINAHQAASLDD